MRTVLSAKLEAGRIRKGPMGSTKDYGPYGMFHVIGPCASKLFIMASGGEPNIPWEHVSVSRKQHTPNWLEMCWVKDQFWNDEECVMQLHPPKSQYVNNHDHCLHLWRPINYTIQTPPAYLVGVKALGTLSEHG